MSAALQYTDLLSVLARAGDREEAAGFHGLVCGALCRQPPEAVDPQRLLTERELTVDDETAAQLRRLRDETLESLGDAQTGFVPLLPDDAVALEERAQALGAWCEGFLHGLSAYVPLELKDCSEEVREIVSDFTQFTRAAIGSGDDLEVEEGAYAELVEYVRVGAQLAYMELHPRPAAAADAESYSKTLH